MADLEGRAGQHDRKFQIVTGGFSNAETRVSHIGRTVPRALWIYVIPENTHKTTSQGGEAYYFGAPGAMSFLMTFPPFITNLTR